jgi:transposase
MAKMRRRYDRDFKISIIAELEAGKPLAQIAREYSIHPSLLVDGKRNGRESRKSIQG